MAHLLVDETADSLAGVNQAALLAVVLALKAGDARGQVRQRLSEVLHHANALPQVPTWQRKISLYDRLFGGKVIKVRYTIDKKKMQAHFESPCCLKYFWWPLHSLFSNFN